MKTQSKILFFSIFLFACLELNAQSSDTEKILEQLTILQEGKGGSSGDDEGSSDGYKSFVMNEFKNTVNSLNQLDIDEQQQIFFKELNEKRLELAVQLCQTDQRACFLMDQYREYDYLEQLSSEPKLFGVDIFSGFPTSFDYYDDIPLTGDYVLRNGDKIKISAFGNLEIEEVITIDREGKLNIPQVGSIQISGQAFDMAYDNITAFISNRFIGTELIITLDQVRAKKIFVMGNVNNPGSYAVHAFGNILNAIISAGGFKPNSSLRSIQLIRGNQFIAEADLYSLLIDGKVPENWSLDDGDTVLVKGLENSVLIDGEINRPAIYEFVEGDTVEDLVRFALGPNQFADMRSVSIKRITNNGFVTVINPANFKSTNLNKGDEVNINSIVGKQVNFVSIKGHTRKKGNFEFRKNMTLGQIFSLEKDIYKDTYNGIAVIKRFDQNTNSSRYLTFSLIDQEFINEMRLFSGDELFLFSKNDIEFINSKTLSSHIDSYFFTNDSNDNLNEENQDQDNDSDESDLSNRLPDSLACLSSLSSVNTQSTLEFISSKLTIFKSEEFLRCTDIFLSDSDLLPILLFNSIPVLGNVRKPGIYPISSSVSARSLFLLAGGFLQPVKSNSNVSIEVGSNNLFNSYADLASIAEITNLSLLNVKYDIDNINTGFVTLVGEFKNPGIYQIDSTTRLLDVYQRADGLTNIAYPLGGILSRESVKELESKALKRAEAELSEILASAVTRGYLDQNSTDLVGLIALMTTLSNTDAIGRLVTELNPNVINKNPSLNISLRDGDIIYMPKLQNVVTVAGQVSNSITVPYDPKSSFKDYISLAGGFKSDADRSAVYAVLPNGTSARMNENIFNLSSSNIMPGSTIIVPRDDRPLDGLSLVETISPILASLSITAASIAAINNN